MMWHERRVCIKCNYPVVYMVISDAHDPDIVEQFVATILEGDYKDSPAVTSKCPKCGESLSLDTTEPVATS